MPGSVIDQKQRDPVLGSAAVNEDLTAEGSERGRRRRPELATFLSFVWPGLGQAYAGRGLLAVLFALPILAIAGLGVYLFLEDREIVAFRMFAPGVALGLTGVILAAGLWRLLSMLHANAAAGGPRAWGTRPVAVLTILSVLVVGAHVGVARLTWSIHEEAGRIFTSRDPFADEPLPSFAPETPAPSISLEPGATPLPSASLVPVPSEDLPAQTPLAEPPPSVAPPPEAPESNRLNIL